MKNLKDYDEVLNIIQSTNKSTDAYLLIVGKILNIKFQEKVKSKDELLSILQDYRSYYQRGKANKNNIVYKMKPWNKR